MIQQEWSSQDQYVSKYQKGFWAVLFQLNVINDRQTAEDWKSRMTEDEERVSQVQVIQAV